MLSIWPSPGLCWVHDNQVLGSEDVQETDPCVCGRPELPVPGMCLVSSAEQRAANYPKADPGSPLSVSTERICAASRPI